MKLCFTQKHDFLNISLKTVISCFLTSKFKKFRQRETWYLSVVNERSVSRSASGDLSDECNVSVDRFF